MSSRLIVLGMVLTIALLGALASWDDRREAAASLADFAREQATLAREVAAGAASTDIERASAPVIEEPQERIVVVHVPGVAGLETSSGATARVPRLEEALDGAGCAVTAPTLEDCSLALTHEASALLGLPPRMAMAGLATAVSARGDAVRLAVVTTAKRERDRERRSASRLLLSFLLSSGLVLALGFAALRAQRKELLLAHDMAMKARDERLVRADKLATLGALATGIAHEVSTPLGVIVGRGEQLLPKVAGDARAEKAVSAILEQAARIGEIVRAFLALARGARPSLVRMSAAEVATAASDLVQHRYERAHVELTSSTTPDGADPGARVDCDRRLLEQAIVNLLLNACDACAPGGHVDLRVAAEGGSVAFEVEDDGPGIAPEAARRATEPFFTTKAEGAGAGLGLAITKEIVQHHRGTLTIARRGERGTVARILLPGAEGA
jgi:signal transduction histidine kinase